MGKVMKKSLQKRKILNVTKDRRKYLLLGAVIFCILTITAVNMLAWNHAHAMTHFTSGGERTKGPEEIDFIDKINVLFSGVNIPKPQNQQNPSDLEMEFQVINFSSGEYNLEAWFVPPNSENKTDATKYIFLMLPGYVAAKDQLLPEARELHDMNHAVFMLDFRGCGGSSGMETTVGYHEADDVAEAVKLIKEKWPGWKIIIYGRSMGSVAAMLAIAEKYIDVDGVILECPFDKFQTAVTNRFQLMGLPSFPLAQLLVFWGGVQQGVPGFKHNPVDYAKRINIPILLLQGGSDPHITIDQSRAIFRNFPGKKILKISQSSGHESYLLKDPEFWHDTMEDFLEFLNKE